jgi:hypothetical protein
VQEAAERGSLWGEVEALFRSTAMAVGGAVESLDDKAAIDFLHGYQNPNGSLDDTSLQTALLLAAYHALRLPHEDARILAAVRWLRGMLVPTPDGQSFWSCFTGDVWATALAGRALLVSGTPLDDPGLAHTINWFLDTQVLDERLVASTPRRGATKTGGWAFEGGNVTMPDSDDTGLVLATLGLVADRSDGKARLAPELSARLLTASENACTWLEGEQNPDGGWGAFDYWEGHKPRGPMYTEEVGLISGGLLHTLKNIIDPPIALGAPAWEDVTARVLYGLGNSGYTVESPVVARAIEFLRQQQLDHGGWWGRWMVNYLPTTSCVLMGLAAVGVHLDEPWVKKGIDFLLAHQNADGGWGEDEETYADPSRAGTGPSMPPLTGLVLSALILSGRGRTPAVARGIAYLIHEQRPDGTWPNADWLHAFFPPQSFYVYFLMPSLYTLEALGRFRTLMATGEVDVGGTSISSRARVEDLPQVKSGPSRNPDGSWNEAYLDEMRTAGDPLADDLVRGLLGADAVQPVNSLLATLLRSDDPVPPGLPDALRTYFESTAALPEWADPKRIAMAERLFVRAGWSVAAGLFCGSLPQTYAAAKGAKVLLYSGRLDSDVRRRVLETAQFIFDVTDKDGMSQRGRGVRTVQKVRLMHATIRLLTLQQARWDMSDGLPINQEDLAGTLLAFSFLILDALDRFGVETTRDEREAWMHLWNVVGLMLGINPALLPRDEADGAALTDLLRRRQWAPSPHGELLARALVSCMADYLPGPGLDRLPTTLIRHLAGDACADLLKLPRSDWTSVVVDTATEVLSLFQRRDRQLHIARLLQRFSAELMKAMIGAQRDGKQAPFRIPESLRST